MIPEVKPSGTLKKLVDLIEDLRIEHDIEDISVQISHYGRQFYIENEKNMMDPEFMKHLPTRANLYMCEKLREHYDGKSD